LLEDAGRIDVAHDPFARGAALSAIFSDAGKRRERRRRRWRRVFIVVLVLFVAWCLLAWSSRLPGDAHHEFSRSQVANDSTIALSLAA
jgi:hypothetical protein